MVEVVEKTNKNPQNIRRVLKKDIFPSIGTKRLSEFTVKDILLITDRIEARGSDQVALLTRNINKRLFAYAIARQKVTENPAAAIEARYVATANSRDVALTSVELGKLLRAIYSSSMRRSHKLALHLLILRMVRKSELNNARWEEIDYENSEWRIPSGRSRSTALITQSTPPVKVKSGDDCKIGKTGIRKSHEREISQPETHVVTEFRQLYHFHHF